ncbi:YdeI/OmpD-associated family protein [Herbiconiux moechotypicola]|uniref:YdeI/OmpD-associated family protein n=1 Tax=Herbiconiux moechotypicola TaxID=637393 RepID=A0ABN3DEZ0_9MICO|nr:YdeI/OmpD-associated family protein [Herbiconiux moechotypicola]MCS5729339.1 YdeI/OmpD-associated family protein [Herbiconiux moechotypicola]
MTATIRFEAPVVTRGERRIAFLPAEASAALPSRGQVAVEGTLDGRPFEVAVVEPDGLRGHWIDVERLSAGLQGDPAGAPESVTLEFAPAGTWPEPEVPADLQTALDGAPASAATWADITPMARWEWVRWIASTRSPGTRARRVEVGIDKLDRGSRRPCCFDLSSCTDPELAKSGKLAR